MIRKLRFTVDDFERLIHEGFFDQRSGQIELIEGELIEMSPASAEHDDLIEWLHHWSMTCTARDSFRIRVQSGISIPQVASLPEPDLVWLRPADYRHRRPTAENVALLIEVAISSLDYDRSVKASLYARAGIEDYWIVNYSDRCVEVHRDPQPAGYAMTRIYRPGERLSPRCVPNVACDVQALFA